jgi:hypothetical protein
VPGVGVRVAFYLNAILTGTASSKIIVISPSLHVGVYSHVGGTVS